MPFRDPGPAAGNVLIPWKGEVPWNSRDDNTRLPTAGELEGGFTCGPADQKLFNYTNGYSWGQVHNVILDAGLEIDRTDLTQLTAAIKALVAASVPVGAEIMWSGANVPAGWLEQDGSAFNAEEYPLLAAHLGGNVLPDMRGEFARGWDHGRGIDNGRVLKSAQAGSPIPIEDVGGRSINCLNSHNNYDSGAGAAWTFLTSNDPVAANPFTDVNGAYRGISRPRNIAKIFLIKHD